VYAFTGKDRLLRVLVVVSAFVASRVGFGEVAVRGGLEITS